MTQLQADWIFEGKGQTPSLAWALSLDAPLLDIKIASETGDILLGDAAGSLYRVNCNGNLKETSSDFRPLACFDYCDDGGVAGLKTGIVVRFEIDLSLKTSLPIKEKVLATAIDPFGQMFAVSEASGDVSVFDSNGQLISTFRCSRPLRFMRFVVDQPALIGSSDFGWISRVDLQGREIWREMPASNIGGLAISGNGGRNFLAAHNHGVLRYNQSGKERPPLEGLGTVLLICTSYDGERMGSYTIEGDIYWGDETGKSLWTARTPSEVQAIASDPLGTRLIVGMRDGNVFCLDWNA